MIIDTAVKPDQLSGKLDQFWKISGEKILGIESEFDHSCGAPVVTVQGKYRARGWTEWTQGFEYGSALLQFDATGNDIFLETGRINIRNKMAFHISHMGVHDHGFNIVSTYGNLFRLMKEGKIPFNGWEESFYALAIRLSGAVQASRWSKTADGGFIYSFNGPHSLFVDTIRSTRVLMLAHQLGHYLAGENDSRISLLHRGIEHLMATARYSVYYGEGRDRYDVPGRTAHESIFNFNDGNYRCPNSQQGYSGFSTWTRGLAWAILGFAEELEFMATFAGDQSGFTVDYPALIEKLTRAAKVTCEFYISNTPADGIPYWDTGAPGLSRMGNYLDRPADPFNDHEPVDSSAAAIAAQGLLRFGHYLMNLGETAEGGRYWQAGLTITARLLESPYLAVEDRHHGILLHSVYHRPNGWDYIPAGFNVPCNESSMWGDYHMRETALFLRRIIENEPYYTFFNGII